MSNCSWCGGPIAPGRAIHVSAGFFGADGYVCCERCKIEWKAAHKK